MDNLLGGGFDVGFREFRAGECDFRNLGIFDSRQLLIEGETRGWAALIIWRGRGRFIGSESSPLRSRVATLCGGIDLLSRPLTG